MAAISAMYKYGPDFKRTILVNEKNFAELVKLGDTTIRVNKNVMGPICGLIPVGGSCRLTTEGLKWNLEDGLLSFGGLVSSSNEFVDDEVKINCQNNPVVWTTELK